MLDLCIRQIPSITFFGVNQDEMVNVCVRANGASLWKVKDSAWNEE